MRKKNIEKKALRKKSKKKMKSLFHSLLVLLQFVIVSLTDDQQIDRRSKYRKILFWFDAKITHLLCVFI